MEGFSMAEFSGMLEHRKDELYGDVFDLLMTLSSFDAFKELMLAYKAGGVYLSTHTTIKRLNSSASSLTNQ